MANLLKKRKLDILGNKRYISMPIQYTNIDKLIGLGCYGVVFKGILNTEYDSDSDSNEKTKKVPTNINLNQETRNLWQKDSSSS